MLVSLRSALLVCAALSAGSVAPAQVGDEAQPMQVASLPTAPIDQLLDPSGEPTLSDDQVEPSEAVDAVTEPLLVEPARPSGDLADMVAELRSSDPGSRELECLAVGVYFEGKSEPVVGQLAVGEVIANRPNSNGRFPAT